MSTSQRTVDYLIEQLTGLGQASIKKMFGEYCLYLAGKPIALICDDQLFLKPTKVGGGILSTPVERAPYPGAKNHYLVPADRWEDSDWLCHLISTTCSELPSPKLKSKRKKS